MPAQAALPNQASSGDAPGSISPQYALWERSVVIPFLIVTSIVNIALGYALAVYLGKAHAPAMWGESSATTPTAAMDLLGSVGQFSMAPKSPSRPVDATVASPSAAAGRIAEQPADDAAGSHLESHDEDAPFARSEVMEQELLAGIEEFRNQLSQLKGQGVPGVFLDPLTAS